MDTSRSSFGRALRPLTIAVIATLVACATQRPEPEPTAPPRALQITAQRRQSQSQQDRDKADCQSQAGSMATSSEGWTQIFVGCMSGRGYRVDDAYGR